MFSIADWVEDRENSSEILELPQPSSFFVAIYDAIYAESEGDLSINHLDAVVISCSGRETEPEVEFSDRLRAFTTAVEIDNYAGLNERELAIIDTEEFDGIEWALVREFLSRFLRRRIVQRENFSWLPENTFDQLREKALNMYSQFVLGVDFS